MLNKKIINTIAGKTIVTTFAVFVGLTTVLSTMSLNIMEETQTELFQDESKDQITAVSNVVRNYYGNINDDNKL